MKRLSSDGYSRRSFIRASAIATAPLIIPASALGRDGAVAPSNRIGLGLIGCGNRMNADWNALRRCEGVEGVAVCDPWGEKRASYRRKLGLQPGDAYVDFRELIARSDVDAVAIATPDHWHVPIAIAAMAAGKDVYCEKPLSNTIREGRALVDAAKRYGAIFQHGTQLHSFGGVRRACELVRNGRLGEMKEIVIGSPPGIATGHHPEQPVPDGIDYDMWLGPAPYTPYCDARVMRVVRKFPGWYFVSDYSKAGWIAGYGVHDLDIAQWAMGMERSGPVEIEGEGVYPTDGLFNTILTYRIEFKYTNGVRLTMTDTGQNRHGVTFIGEKGRVFTRGGIEAEPRSLLDEEIGVNEVRLYRMPTDHAQNFIDCVRSRAETITPPEIAHRATSTALLGGIACQLKRPLRWDPAKERFVDDPEADRLLTCGMRSPWKV